MIRRMNGADADAVWEIFVTSLGYSCTADVVRRRIADLEQDAHHVMLVWEDEATGSVDGFIHAERYETLHDEGGWNVIALAVMPRAQGNGIGRALLAAVEGLARDGGGAFVRLNSRVERVQAHGFYEHLGYDCDKVQKRFIKRFATT